MRYKHQHQHQQSFIIKLAYTYFWSILTDDGQVDFVIAGGRVFEIDPALVHGRVLVADVLQDERGRLRLHAEVPAAVQRLVVGPMGTADRGPMADRHIGRRGRCRGGGSSDVVAETREPMVIIRTCVQDRDIYD